MLRFLKFIRLTYVNFDIKRAIFFKKNILLYMCIWLGFLYFPKGVVMYSREFMRFLIKYQTPDYDESIDRKVEYFKFGVKNNKLASVLLTNKK